MLYDGSTWKGLAYTADITNPFAGLAQYSIPYIDPAGTVASNAGLQYFNYDSKWQFIGHEYDDENPTLLLGSSGNADNPEIYAYRGRDDDSDNPLSYGDFVNTNNTIFMINAAVPQTDSMLMRPNALSPSTRPAIAGYMRFYATDDHSSNYYPTQLDISANDGTGSANYNKLSLTPSGLVWDGGQVVFDNLTTATLPTGQTGGVVFNTTESKLAFYDGSSWQYPVVESDDVANQNYAEIYILDSDPDTLSFVAGSTSRLKISETTDGESSANFTLAAGKLTYTGTANIKCAVNVSLSVTFGEAVQLYTAVHVNGVEKYKLKSTVGVATAGIMENISISGLLDISQNDYIEVYTWPATHGGTDDVIVYNYNLSVSQ